MLRKHICPASAVCAEGSCRHRCRGFAPDGLPIPTFARDTGSVLGGIIEVRRPSFARHEVDATAFAGHSLRSRRRCSTQAGAMHTASPETLRTAAYASCITIHHHAVGPSLTVRTIATMPARTGSGSPDHALTTAANSGYSCAESAKQDAKTESGVVVTPCGCSTCADSDRGSSPLGGGFAWIRGDSDPRASRMSVAAR